MKWGWMAYHFHTLKCQCLGQGEMETYIRIILVMQKSTGTEENGYKGYQIWPYQLIDARLVGIHINLYKFDINKTR